MNENDPKNHKGAEYFDTDHLKSNLRKRAIQGAGITVFSRTIVYFINMSSVFVLARLLTPNDFGLVAMVTSLTMLLLDFGVLGLTEVTVQREKITHRQISTLFWINIGLSLLFTLLMMASAPLIVKLYNEPQLKSITIFLSIALVLNGLSIQHIALLKRSMQFHRFAILEIVAALLSIVSAIVFAVYGWGYWSLVARQLTLTLVMAIGAWMLCKWRPGPPRRGTGVRPMLRFGLNTLGSNTVYYFTKNIDKVIIGWGLGAQPLGFYSRAYHLFVLPLNQLSFPLGSVVVSALSRLRNEPERYRRYYIKSITTLALIGMPLSAVLTLSGSDIILLLLGSQWVVAGEIFTYFGPGIGIMLIYMSNGWLHMSHGRPDRLLIWSIISFVATVILILIALPYGLIGVTIAYTTSFYILLCPCLYYAGKPVGLKLSTCLSAIWRYYLAAFVAGLISWYILRSLPVTSEIYFDLNILFRLTVTTLLCCLLYLFFVVLFYKSLAPLTQFLSILGDMLPASISKKIKRK